jgi:hypothetical protein
MHVVRRSEPCRGPPPRHAVDPAARRISIWKIRRQQANHDRAGFRIGDEAYYELFKSESSFLVVRKGSTAFNVRILNGLKLKPFTLDEKKTKAADLAKAADLTKAAASRL